MRLCDRTILADAKTQVVGWSLEREHQPHVNGTKHGSVIGPPYPVGVVYVGNHFSKVPLLTEGLCWCI